MTALLAERPPQAAGAAAPPCLELRGVTKRFGGFAALNGVDLDIPQSSFVCFLGPSGCGKSTLLRAIAGLDPQTAGTIRQNGRDISHLPPAERDFGIVFQSYALFPNLTARDNVAYGLVNRRLPKVEITRIVDELLAVVGLPDAGRKYPGQLSGGQQQRIALARALATEPGLLLLDEPLSALDARVRLSLRDEIRGLQRRLGVTTIMVTHDQDEALTMADQIVVMNQGRIEQIGDPLTIYNHPASLFVADFIGTMSAFTAELGANGLLFAGAARLHAQPPAGFAPGDRVAVRIRPEALSLAAAPATDVISGEVASLTFHGPTVRVAIACGLPNDALLKLDVTPRDPALRGLREGSLTQVRVPNWAPLLFPLR